MDKKLHCDKLTQFSLNINTYVLSHTPVWCSEMCCLNKVRHSSTVPLEKVRIKCLAQGHLDRFVFHLVCSVIQTSDLLVTGPML